MNRTILWATLVAGTLDILSAFLWTWMAGGDLATVLPGVASGPFGDKFAGDPLAAPIGLAVHFAIMLAMAAAYVWASSRWPQINRHWALAGLLYGLLLWLVMYWIVLPLRWDVPFPSGLGRIARQLVSHCLLVGLPIAWIAARRAPR